MRVWKYISMWFNVLACINAALSFLQCTWKAGANGTLCLKLYFTPVTQPTVSYSGFTNIQSLFLYILCYYKNWLILCILFYSVSDVVQDLPDNPLHQRRLRKWQLHFQCREGPDGNNGLKNSQIVEDLLMG